MSADGDGGRWLFKSEGGEATVDAVIVTIQSCGEEQNHIEAFFYLVFSGIYGRLKLIEKN